jgi:membrane protease YdiL (CAAX protease family)
MRTGEATGFQITFLVFAVTLLAVPLSNFISRSLGSTPAEDDFIGRFVPFVLGAIVLWGFPGLRKIVQADLSKGIPRECRREVVAVALLDICLLFSFFGAVALWCWITGGPELVALELKGDPPAVEYAKALSAPGLLMSILLAVIVGPPIEELVFRGMLYRAWAQRWGGLAAAILTSSLFAAYHPHFLAVFSSAILFVCLVRRTGTLWASISVHSFSNFVLWYPILGPWILPAADNPSGELSPWSGHLVCLAISAFAFPAYIWLAARRPYAVQA